MEYAVIAILLAASAFFSAMDTACSSANRIRLRSRAEAGDKKAEHALKIIEDFDKTITTILVGNNIVNIASTAIGTVVCVRIFGDNMGPTMSTVIMTLLVLLFGEVLPKCYGKRNAEKLTIACAGILDFLRFIFTPLSILFVGLQRFLMKKADDTEVMPSVTSDELKVLIDEISEEGVLKEQETDLVQSALAFGSTMAKEILTPRVDVFAIDLDDDPDSIRESLYQCRYSRIPVYRDSIDNIKGVIYKSEYFAKLAVQGSVNLNDLVREVLYIPATLKISHLLKDLKRRHIHMAIVFDEYGGTLGIVSLEDVLEELVGEIWDESDTEEHPIVKTAPGTFLVEGDCDLEELFDTLGRHMPEDIEAQTVGGWVLYVLERIPAEGDSFTYEDCTVTVKSMVDNRIETVEVTIPVE